MASPKISTSRRVLGDINSNINTFAHEPRHASLVSDTREISAGNKSFKTILDIQQVVGGSTTEIQQENRREITADLQVGSLKVGKVHQGISSQNLENTRTATVDSLNSGTSLGLLNAKSIQWAGKRRSFAATEDNLEDIGIREREGHGKRMRIELQPHEEFVNSTTTQQNHSCSQCSRATLEHGVCTESSGLQFDGCGHENVGERCNFHGGIRRSSQFETSFASPTSSFSTVEVEDIDITGVNSQASKITMTEENSSKFITASTTKNSRTSKSKSLSREEIRQKSQALRLRLSLANYKVKTNQIDLPLSRLQIHSTSPNLPSLAHFRANPYNANVGSRTPLPGAPAMNTIRKTLIPVINLQRPSSSSRDGRIYVRKDKERENIREGDMNENIPSIPPLSEDNRRDSAISCTSFTSKSSTFHSGPGHAHPYALTPYLREENINGRLGNSIQNELRMNRK
ncbi:6f3057b9-acfe-4630-a320-1b7a3a02d8a5 [Sclerotinia trifoliorum]|uniref:6f3057b9-acfe-4630-a320-1b7a3a02d8a5 n=1 Tax=Sclerotinia trifoliorum TaxID=28548 RepID=A0A8H2VR59_9HELO|nr:6f3057b9-acfe-4630-a320-1b7a3a02d8a5 [Sclerotinia trifoliorum]